jgi:hypothetical protein
MNNLADIPSIFQTKYFSFPPRLPCPFKTQKTYLALHKKVYFFGQNHSVGSTFIILGRLSLEIFLGLGDCIEKKGTTAELLVMSIIYQLFYSLQLYLLFFYNLYYFVYFVYFTFMQLSYRTFTTCKT